MARSWISKRDSKILEILLMTTEVYLLTGQPVSSKTLKDYCCSQLSTATLRNYFSELETAGFLKKNHASGGRIPTNLAFRYYVDHCRYEQNEISEETASKLNQLPQESKNIIRDLQKASEILSEILQLPVCFSAPRFDSDAITKIQLTPVDEQRIVMIVSTEFGQIFTDVLWLPQVCSSQFLKNVEQFLLHRIRDQHIDTIFSSSEEEQLCIAIYNEIIVRYLTKHCHFSEEDIYQTNLSSLLKYDAFKDPDTLTQGLFFFEDRKNMRALLNIGMYKDQSCAFIGHELASFFGIEEPKCAIITVPYFLNTTPLGAFGVLGAVTLPYKKIFATLHLFAEKIKTILTQTFYKFRLSFRMPCPSYLAPTHQEASLNRNRSIHLLSFKEMS